MAVLRIDIAGNPKTVPFRNVLHIGASSIGMLDDLDHAFSHEPQGATEWLMNDTAMNGALRIELASRVRQMKRKILPDVGSQIANSFVSGTNVLEVEGRTPAYLSEIGMKYATRMTSFIGREGVSKLIASVPLAGESTITSKSADNIAKLISAPYSSLGSVEGHLEGINLHDSARFIVYEKRTLKAVTCHFGDFRKQLMDKIKDSLEHRVSVSGRLFRNAKGEPVRIKLLSSADLKVFGTDLKVLPFRDLGGSDRDFTDGEPSHVYTRRMRG